MPIAHLQTSPVKVDSRMGAVGEMAHQTVDFAKEHPVKAGGAAIGLSAGLAAMALSPVGLVIAGGRAAPLALVFFAASSIMTGVLGVGMLDEVSKDQGGVSIK